jgi:O-succinylbenzoate synthase
MLKLYELPNRLILQNGPNFGEIAPLPGFSRETFAEAKEEVLTVFPHLERATLPSVRWGYSCSRQTLTSINMPLAGLGVKADYPTLKLKLGSLGLEEALDLVKAHYKNHRLRLDFNRKWPLEKAVAFARHFHADDFDYLEEPTEDLVAFSKLTGFPIAIDETLPYIPPIPTLKAIVVKPMILGFIPEPPPNVELILSSSHETDLGLVHIANAAQKLQLKGAIGLDTPIETRLLTQPLEKEKGWIRWQATNPPVNLRNFSTEKNRICRIDKVGMINRIR